MEDSEDVGKNSSGRKYYIYLVLFMLSMHEAFHFFGHSVEKGSERIQGEKQMGFFFFLQDVLFGRYEYISHGNKCTLQIWELKEEKSALPKYVLLP